MRPLPHPFDRMIRGEPISVEETGSDLLGRRLFTKDLAFSEQERVELGLRGPPPGPRLLDRGAGRPRGRAHPAQDRRSRAVHRPGRAPGPQRDAVLPGPRREPRGVPADRLHAHRGAGVPGVQPHRPPDARRLDHPGTTSAGSPTSCRPRRSGDVRLIVVTDNERILGPGRPGRRRDGHPDRQARPVHRGVGDPPGGDPAGLARRGHRQPDPARGPAVCGPRAPRLRGAEYDALVEAFVEGVARRPGRAASSSGRTSSSPNALRILDRYRDRVCSFNDDIQGTAAVVARRRSLAGDAPPRPSGWSTSGSSSPGPALPGSGSPGCCGWR